MPNYKILRLDHYGVGLPNEEELEACREFYRQLGFEVFAKDLDDGNRKVIWFAAPDGREFHIFVDLRAALPKEPGIVHGCWEVNDIGAAWETWQDLWRNGWSYNGKTYRMTKQPYKDSKLPGRKDRFHAWDPWFIHTEWYENE